MGTSQVYGHHDKMARTKTLRTSQTRSIQRRNIHKEITIFCVFRIFHNIISILFPIMFVLSTPLRLFGICMSLQTRRNNHT